MISVMVNIGCSNPEINKYINMLFFNRQYPILFLTPPTPSLAAAIANLLRHFHWNYYQVILQPTSYYTEVLNLLKDRTPYSDTCPINIHQLPDDNTTNSWNQLCESLRDEERPRIVVLLMNVENSQ